MKTEIGLWMYDGEGRAGRLNSGKRADSSVMTLISVGWEYVTFATDLLKGTFKLSPIVFEPLSDAGGEIPTIAPDSGI